MINRFSTPPMEAPKSDAGSSNKTMYYVLGALVVGYLAYRFLIKPRMEQKVIVYEDTYANNE